MNPGLYDQRVYFGNPRPLHHRCRVTDDYYWQAKRILFITRFVLWIQLFLESHCFNNKGDLTVFHKIWRHNLLHLYKFYESMRFKKIKSGSIDWTFNYRYFNPEFLWVSPNFIGDSNHFSLKLPIATWTCIILIPWIAELVFIHQFYSIWNYRTLNMMLL